EGLELGAELLDLLRALTVRLLDRGGVEPLAFGARHLLARCVLFVLEALERREQAAPLGFERREILELARQIEPAVAKRGTDGVQVGAEKRRIQHGRSRSYISG